MQRRNSFPQLPDPSPSVVEFAQLMAPAGVK